MKWLYDICVCYLTIKSELALLHQVVSAGDGGWVESAFKRM